MRHRTLLFLLLLCLSLCVTPYALALSLSGAGGGLPTVSCPDTGGNHLNFSGGVWTCGASSSGGAPGNAFADGTTKGIATFNSAQFGDNGSGLISLKNPLSNLTLDNTNTVTLKDTLLTLQDDATPTKQLRFELSSIAPATTRTLTIPNENGTLCTTGSVCAGYFAEPGSNGLLTRTGPGSIVGRTVTGTANQIAVTNGDGVSGNPVLSIPTNPTLPGTTTGTFSGSLTGTASLATALAADGANCAAGQFAQGVDASGAAQGCTALPTTISGTTNQITASASTGAITLAIPTNPVLPGITTGTFSGPLTGNASTATALAANGTNCSAGQAAAGVDASGNAEGCFTPSGSGTGHTIQEEGSSLAARTNLNFLGTAITCVDNAGANATDCTVTGGGSGGHTIQEDGSSLAARTNLNFTGAGITCTDSPGTNSTNCAVSGLGSGAGIFGTPTAGQLAVFHDATSIEGVSGLSITYAATHVATNGTPTTTIEYVTTGSVTDVTRTLPAAASGTNTREYIFIKEDAGTAAMSIMPNGTDTINGGPGPLATLTQWGGFLVKEASPTGWVATPFAPTLATGGGGGGSGVVDTGVNGQVARYTAANTVAGAAGVTFDAASGDVLTLSPKVTLMSADLTLGQHNIIACTSGTGTVIATLPVAATAPSKRYTVVKTDNAVGTCRVKPATGEQLNWVVDGTQDITTRGDSLTLTLMGSGVWLSELGLTTSSLASVPVTRSIWFGADSLKVSGACTEIAPAALVTNGPIVSSIGCTDTDTDGINFDVIMPDGWNGSTITLELQGFYINAHASPNNIVDMNFSGQCVRDGDTVAAFAITSGATAESTTNVEAVLTTSATPNREVHGTTAALTLAGTCAGGAHVYIHGLIDAGSTNFTPMSDFKLLGVKLEYTRVGND